MGGVESKNFEEHRNTYAMFLGLTKWGTIGVAALLVLMRIFLVH
jgi:hypothetical protein